MTYLSTKGRARQEVQVDVCVTLTPDTNICPPSLMNNQHRFNLNMNMIFL